MNNNSLEKQEMKSTRAVTFGLIGAALLASTASFATPLIKSHEVCRAHNNHSHHPIFLSATQKKEFASIRQSYRKQMVPLMQGISGPHILGGPEVRLDHHKRGHKLFE